VPLSPARLLPTALVAALAAATLTLAAQAATTTEIHVATNGNDAAAGTPTAPLRTLTAAKAAVRLKLPTSTGPIAVIVHGGTYALGSTLAFGPSDSGTATSPVSYSAAAGESVTLTGGHRITSQWSTHQGSIKVTTVGTGLDFDQLYAAGQRQILARYPNFSATTAILDGYASDATSATRAARWSNPTTGYVRALHNNMWGGNSFKITGIGGDGKPTLSWVGDNNRGSGINSTYQLVENLFEELDAPGEWFYDKTAGKLYFWPPAGVDPATTAIDTADLEELIRVEGTSPTARAGKLTFAGFRFTGTHRTLFTRPYEKLQLGDWAVARAGAVYVKNAVDVTIKDSTFDQLGGNGVFFDGHNSGHLVTGNVFRGSGASDVLAVGSHAAVREPSTWASMRRTITDVTPGPKTEDYPRDITISGNEMADMGRFEKQTSGVHISMSARITVRGNTVHDSPRACVNINDGTWGGHKIVDNDIFRCVKETSDHGPINAWGRDRWWPLTATDATKKQYAKLDAVETTDIAHNRIWHSSEWAIDLDDGSSNYTMHDNLLLNAGIKLREGFFRSAYNNILVNGGGHFHVTPADSGDRVERNIFAAKTPYHFIQSDPATSKTIYDYNLFYNNGNTVDGIDSTWTGKGLDTHSVIADPKFAGGSPWLNPAMTDYSLAAGSPAPALGFVGFPMSGFGKAGAPTPPPVEWDAGSVVVADNEPLMGATVSGIYSEALKSSVGLGDFNGLYFLTAPSGSYAATQGLQAADVIRQVGGQQVTDKASFFRLYNALPPGGATQISVWRNQAALTLTLTKTTAAELLNNTSGVVYTGSGWDYKNASRGGAGSHLDDLHATQTVGDSFSFTFNGTGLDIISQLAADEGKADLYVDNVLTTLDYYSATRKYQQVVHALRGLAPGLHTIKGVMKTGSYFLVDAFRTMPASLAAGRPATQSSLAYGGAPGRAVDGNANGTYWDGSVTHTDSTATPWWQVDLGTATGVGGVQIWNRTDCCANRLSDYWVFVSATPFNTSLSPAQQAAQAGVWSSHQPTQAGRPTTIPVGQTGRYVMVQLAGSGYLSLAEVVVTTS